jgi:DtxR family Mn-dependent transcriptional regulator
MLELSLRFVENPNMSSVIKENYLKALFFLSERDSTVTLTDLGKAMQVSKPTVNDMVKKLGSKGWIEYQRYKPLKITESGKRAAALVIRKHRISEMFLAQVMGFGWEEVHEIAEELEHIKSEKFFDRMNELMGYPSVDPHGSPIPDKDGNINHPDYKPLTELQESSRAIIKGIRDSSTDLLLFLNKKGLTLGTEIILDEVESFDQSIVISTKDSKSLHLSHSVANHLLVQLI